MDLRAKLQAGRNETASRALEVVRVQSQAKSTGQEAGLCFAEGFVDVCSILDSTEGDKRIWEGGLREVIRVVVDGKVYALRAMLMPATHSFREGFVQGILALPCHGDHTVIVVKATTAVEYGVFGGDTGEKTISALLEDIGQYPGEQSMPAQAHR